MTDEYMKSIAISWAAANAEPRRLMPDVPLTDRRREYHDAASHSDVTRFLLRQIERGLRLRK